MLKACRRNCTKNFKAMFLMFYRTFQSFIYLICKTSNMRTNLLMLLIYLIENYVKKAVKEIIKKLKKIKPDIKFSSDFIIGYPGETYDDFKKTIKLINEVKFINSFSYIFSARPGTPAFELEGVEQKDAKIRLIEFQKTAEMIKKDYKAKLLKKIVKVLFENKIKNENKYFGRDEFFNSVIVESNNNLTGKIKKVKIIRGNQSSLFGEIISDLNQTNYAA